MFTSFNLKDCIGTSQSLAEKVNKDFEPDLVVGIANGGILPALEIANTLKIGYVEVVARRNIDLSETYKKYPSLKLFISIYQGVLFFTTNPSIVDEGGFCCKDKKILIVDDMIHTGKTFQIVRQNLLSRGASDLKIATLAAYGKGKDIVDYWAYEGNTIFPWSKNHSEYNKRLERFNNRSPIATSSFK